MATEITMPKLSDTMEEGRLISWKKVVGERVERGDIIAEVETDKANMELEAFVSGVFLEARVGAGEMVPVGAVIAIIGEAGEKVAPGRPPQPVVKAAPPPPPAMAAMEVPPAEAAAPTPTAAPGPGQSPAEEKASPMVRRLAREQGIELRRVAGSGPDGRVLREDLERFLVERGGTTEGGEKPPPPAEGEAPVIAGEVRPLSRMRAAIARTVSASWRSIPHFAVDATVEMGAVERLVRGLRESGISATINDLVVKACAMALKRFPGLNSSFADQGITLHGEINIGIAVSLDEGLVVPVIRGCQGLSLEEIGVRSRDLVARARGGRISESDIAGGTFSVSNLGMFGVDRFTAVILPPQAAILAVAAIRDTALVREGAIVPGRVMRVTLSADHRVVDGADAARFLAELGRILENPFLMLV